LLPGGATERAMIEAMAVLVARELADFAKRSFVEIIAIAIEAIFGEVFIVFDAILRAELFRFGPGFSLNLKELDI